MRRVAEIASFHAHVYFDGEAEAAAARALREAVAELWAAAYPRYHQSEAQPPAGGPQVRL